MTRQSTQSAKTIRRIYDLLFEAFGPQHWWPAETRDEIVIGAVLTQNTSWKNVERAIAALRQADCLTLRKIDRTSVDRLAELIRSSGTHRVKARRLKNLTTWLAERYQGDLDALFAVGQAEARRGLLAVNGIGPETADSILLYAGDIPVFVVDAYTRRVMRRHHVIGPDSGYADTQALLQRALPLESQLYGEYHALLVEVGKRHCRRQTQCGNCPLASLPHDAHL